MKEIKLSKLNELTQELHTLRQTQFDAVKEMKDTFEEGSEISVEKKQAIEDRNVEIEKTMHEIGNVLGRVASIRFCEQQGGRLAYHSELWDGEKLLA